MDNEVQNKANEFFKDFQKKMWTTKGCRFSANRRLARKQQASTFTMSILSIYVIAASLTSFGYSNQLPPEISKSISIVAIVASIFILVLNNIESNKHYGLRAAMLLKSAQKISAIHNELDYQVSTGIITSENFSDIKNKYDAQISDIPENHEDIDFYHFLTHHRPDFNLEGYTHLGTVYTYKALYFLNIWGFYSILLMLPPAFVAAMLFV